jgi:hypothetical protein
VVQAFPSSQALVLFVWTHPAAGLHVSVVQTLPSSQTTGEAPAQLPPPHTSPVVQAFPSSQAFVLLVKAQPVAGLQVSVVHALVSLQMTGVAPTQLPPPHTSPVVQAFPSSQTFALFVKTQPVAGLQVSVVHPLASLQITGVAPAQLPPPHTSPVVQAFPSSQAFVLFVKTQPVAGLHVSVVQTLLSSQTTGEAPAQLPPPHTSLVVQAFPSSQAFVLFVKTQPVAGLQVSVVHALVSLQTTTAPPLHAPPPHVSLCVHASPSVHAVPSFAFGFEQTPVAGAQTPATWH